MSRFPIMIDSGAWSAHTKGVKIDLDTYVQFCHTIRKDYPQAIFVNLDVINNGLGSYLNWIEMRKQGIEALPVYHVVTDELWLLKYLEETDHIGLGAIVKMATSARKRSLDRIWERYLIDEQRMPKVKVHGMGITGFPLLHRYPWYSIDSTSWLQVAMFGHILIPKRRKGGWDYSAMPTKVGFSTLCGDRKEKGTHYSNMSPHEKRILIQYLQEKGFILGFETRGENGEKITVRGVRTWHGHRSDLCTEFFAGFLRSVPWPRPFLPKRNGFGL